MSAQSPVHVSPLLILRDAMALLVLLIGLHDQLRPENAWVIEPLQVPGYAWVLLGVGVGLSLWTLISWGLQWRGNGLIASQDLSD